MKKDQLKNEDYDAINIYYKNGFAEIGGIETMTYNLLKKYSKKKDILVLYGRGHINQLKMLNEVGRVEKYDERRVYRCKKCFVTYESLVPDNIIADTYARVSHGDLFEWNPPQDIWGEILEDGKVVRKKEKPLKVVKVKANEKFKDYNVRPAELDHIPEYGEEFEMDEERAQYWLKNLKRFGECFIEIIKGE